MSEDNETPTKTDVSKPDNPKKGTAGAAASTAKPSAAATTKPDKKETSAETPEEKAAKSRAAMDAAEIAIRAAEKAELDAKLAAEKATAAKLAAEKAAEAEYKAIAEQVKANVAKKDTHTYKRQSEEIFRRDMDEPEFFLEKKDRFPRPVLTSQQQESLTRHAETPQNQTPEYVPEHVLSPEFKGLSNYEHGVESYLENLRSRLAKLKRDPDATPSEMSRIKSSIAYLESLHENFYIGMNVFRTAKGGRSKINA